MLWGGGPIPGRFLCHHGSRGDEWLSGLWTQLLQMGSTMGRTWEEPFQILHWSSRQVPVYRQPGAGSTSTSMCAWPSYVTRSTPLSTAASLL